mgnify:CR=1 FL=1
MNNNICLKCRQHEIPMSIMPHCYGVDYFFSCAKCDWSWYVAEYDNGDEPIVTDAGYFYDLIRSEKKRKHLWECGEEE